MPVVKLWAYDHVCLYSREIPMAIRQNNYVDRPCDVWLSCKQVRLTNHRMRQIRQIRHALLSRRGAMARLARELAVSRTTVSQVLLGRATSARILEAAARRAKELEIGPASGVQS